MDVSTRVRLRRNVLYFAALARDNARFNRQSVIYTIKNFRVPTRGFQRFERADQMRLIFYRCYSLVLRNEIILFSGNYRVLNRV